MTCGFRPGMVSLRPAFAATLIAGFSFTECFSQTVKIPVRMSPVHHHVQHLLHHVAQRH